MLHHLHHPERTVLFHKKSFRLPRKVYTIFLMSCKKTALTYHYSYDGPLFRESHMTTRDYLASIWSLTHLQFWTQVFTNVIWVQEILSLYWSGIGLTETSSWAIQVDMKSKSFQSEKGFTLIWWSSWLWQLWPHLLYWISRPKEGNAGTRVIFIGFADKESLDQSRVLALETHGESHHFLMNYMNITIKVPCKYKKPMAEICWV